MVLPQNRWFIEWKIPFKWMMQEYPYFRKPPYSYICHPIVRYFGDRQSIGRWGDSAPRIKDGEDDQIQSVIIQDVLEYLKTNA